MDYHICHHKKLQTMDSPYIFATARRHCHFSLLRSLNPILIYVYLSVQVHQCVKIHKMYIQQIHRVLTFLFKASFSWNVLVWK